jgi:hypothetical protein
MNTKKLFIIFLLINVTSCFKQSGEHEFSSNPQQPDDKVTISNPTIADNSQNSGGTEVVGTVDDYTTFHPVFSAFHKNDNHSTRYKVIFESAEPSFTVSQISVTGKNLDMESIVPEISINQIATNVFEIISDEFLLLEKLNFYPNFNGIDAKLNKISILIDIDNKNIFENYFLATHLKDNRYGFIKKNQQSSLGTTNTPTCSLPKKINNLGECVSPISLCSDFYTQFENPYLSLTPCKIERDGLPIVCLPMTSQSSCQQKLSNICAQYSDYLEHSAQLFSLHYSDEILGSKTCTKSLEPVRGTF